MLRLALCAITLVMVLSLHGSTRSQPAPRIVSYDDGGMIRGEYLPRINRSIQAGQRVIVDGVCASACTYEFRNPLACVTPQAQLFFHASPALPSVARIPDDHWTMRLYPSRLQALIRANGGLTHQGFWVSGAQLAGVAPLC